MSLIAKNFKTLSLPFDNSLVVKNVSYNTDKYEKQKKKIHERFMMALESHPPTSSLAEIIPDSDDPGTNNHRFYIVLGGRPTAPKKRTFNSCLIAFALTHIKKSHAHTFLSTPQLFAEAQYEPGAIACTHGMLFSEFKNRGHICWSLLKDFNFTGKFGFCESASTIFCVHRKE